jgi:hypothetical protein
MRFGRRFTELRTKRDHYHAKLSLCAVISRGNLITLEDLYLLNLIAGESGNHSFPDNLPGADGISRERPAIHNEKRNLLWANGLASIQAKACAWAVFAGGDVFTV